LAAVLDYVEPLRHDEAFRLQGTTMRRHPKTRFGCRKPQFLVTRSKNLRFSVVKLLRCHLFTFQE